MGWRGGLRWFAHPLVVSCAGGMRSTLLFLPTPCFCSWLFRSGSWVFGFCMLLSRICPNCTYTQLFLLFLFLFFINLLIYLFLAVLGVRCCTRAFSSCGQRGLFFVAVCGLIAVASHCRARALGLRASVVAACGLSSCGSQALEHRLSSCSARA